MEQSEDATPIQIREIIEMIGTNKQNAEEAELKPKTLVQVSFDF